jgi:hypothetical protein
MKKIIYLFIFCLPLALLGQSPIITSFPSLRIPTSSRGLSMGDCGIASAENNQALWYNAAKTAFISAEHQVGIGYTPWMSAISNDTRFLNLNYTARTSESSALGVSLSYLRLGNIQLRDNNGAMIASFASSEYNLLTTFALQFSESGSLGVGLRLLGGRPVTQIDPSTYFTIPAALFSMSADISYFQKFELGEERELAIGAALSNIGPKQNVGMNQLKNFLPTNLGLGIAYRQSITGGSNQFTFAIDANKLLVPSSPVYDGSGNILAGKDPDRSVLNALFSSFSDAPGGLKEELNEVRLSLGTEFAFEKSFFLRAGLCLENRSKGNRKYIGFGTGYVGTINDQNFRLDLHYLVPVSSVAIISPFQNNWGFSLQFGIGNLD